MEKKRKFEKHSVGFSRGFSTWVFLCSSSEKENEEREGLDRKRKNREINVESEIEKNG